MLFAKHFIGAALTLFFCGWTGRSIQASEHHPMRIVLDENGKYQSMNARPYFNDSLKLTM